MSLLDLMNLLRKKIGVIIALPLACAAVTAVAIVVVSDMLDTTVKSCEQAEFLYGLPILGLIMTFAQKDDSDYYRYRSYYGGEKSFDKKPSASSKREFDEEDIDAWARKVGVRAKYLSSPDKEVASKVRKSATYEPKAFKGASE